MRKTITWALASLFLALTAQTALAADFTFEVPVDVSNLHPDITRATISCTAVRYPTTGGFGGGVIVGRSMDYNLTLTDRAYRGTITVEANAIAAHRPGEANGYECGLYFTTARDGLLDSSQYSRLYPPAPGSAPIYRVQGSFPR